MNITVKVIIFLIGSYLIGAIPFAYIIPKIFVKKDIRTIGSGNVGATNVYRAAGLKIAVWALLLDFLKGFAPTLFSVYFFDKNVIISVLAAIACVLGHILTPYLKFKGGKGAATSFGAFIIITPLPMLISIIVFAAAVFMSRMVALGTIICAVIFPLLYFILGYYFNLAFPFEFSLWVMILIVLIAVFITFKHKSNINRIFKGKENKI